MLISTYQQPRELEFALVALSRQSRHPLEVIVGDDGSGAHPAFQVRAVLAADFLCSACQGLLHLSNCGQGDFRRQHRIEHMIIAQIGMGKHIIADLLRRAQASAMADHQPCLWAQNRKVVANRLRVGGPHAGPIPGYGSEETVRRLKLRFDYIFAGQHGYPTICSIDTLDRLRMCAGFGVESCQMPHGPTESTAFRFDADGKSIVYATDFSEITGKMVALAKGCDVLVSDCLKRKKHPTHANLEMAIEFGRRAKAGKTVLSHLDKTMDYATLAAEVPANVIVGYDGLEIVA